MGASLAYETALRVHRDRGIWPARLFALACPSPAMLRELQSKVTEASFLESIVPDDLRRSPELSRELMPVFRADARLAYGWSSPVESLAPLGCGVSAFSGSTDPIAPRMQGWAAFTARDFVHRVVEGGHRFFQTSERETLRFVSHDPESCGACPARGLSHLGVAMEEWSYFEEKIRP